MSPSTGAAGTREWLDVPYAQKDEAKAAGARWDPQAKRWYAPRPQMEGLARWVPLPRLLPGEDRQFGSGLFVDLIPASCWFSNVRSCIAPEDWDRVRRMVYDRAGQRCEACGGERDREAKVWLEAHERWEYDEPNRIQRLRRLVCLCTRCHEVTHFGYALVNGNDRRATTHLMSVNRWSEQDADRHIDEAFAEWERRNLHDWTLDLSMLTTAGVTLAEPPAADKRRGLASDTLHAGEQEQARQLTVGIGSAGGLTAHRRNGTDPSSAAADGARQTVGDAAVPSAGWFTDPAGRYEYRWWDGHGWTAHVSTGGVATTDPLR